MNKAGKSGAESDLIHQVKGLVSECKYAHFLESDGCFFPFWAPLLDHLKGRIYLNFCRVTTGNGNIQCFMLFYLLNPELSYLLSTTMISKNKAEVVLQTS